MPTTLNHDPEEIARFDNSAQHWWDPQGPFKPLHCMNPVRLSYIEQCCTLQNKRVLDIGCGGGLLSEAMARRGAAVTGIDLGQVAIEVARLHALESGVSVHYSCESAEQHLQHNNTRYDVITCLEVLEHVPDPAQLIHTISLLLQPGGHAIFSTLNRTPQSYVFAILGAEYVLNLLPQGTHTYAQFIRPAELARWIRSTQLEPIDLCGLTFNPLTQQCALSTHVDINYLLHATKPVSLHAANPTPETVTDCSG